MITTTISTSITSMKPWPGTLINMVFGLWFLALIGSKILSFKCSRRKTNSHVMLKVQFGIRFGVSIMTFWMMYQKSSKVILDVKTSSNVKFSQHCPYRLKSINFYVTVCLEGQFLASVWSLNCSLYWKCLLYGLLSKIFDFLHFGEEASKLGF